MTADTAEAHTELQQGKSKTLSANRKEELLYELALNPLPVKILASMFGISYQHCRFIKSQNKEKIAHIRAEAAAIKVEEAGKAAADLWVLDPQNRHAIRQGALAKIIEKQHALEDSTDIWEQEHWAKLETLKQQILRYLEDAAGQLPTRTPPVVAEGSKMTYEVKGVDVHETVKDWMDQAQTPT